MSAVRVYLLPFGDDTGLSYAATWTEVTKDVASIKDLAEQLDNTEYDVGIFRTSNMQFSLRNDHGKYNDVGTVETIFKYKRGESLVKVKWEPGDVPLICGFSKAGSPSAIVSEPVTVFTGMLSDLDTKSNIDDLDISFQALGFDNLFSQMVVPYGATTNGDTIDKVMFTLLNQAPFNTLITVSQSNVVAGISSTIDDKSSLQNKTVLESLRTLLVASNSVLYFRNGVIYVSGRTASPTLGYTFYGPGATAGIESISTIADYSNGINHVFNYWTWKNTTFLAMDPTSIAQNGYQKKEISFDPITDSTKQSAILAALKNEFANKKREMLLVTPINSDRLGLYLLDQVSVDYPSPAIPADQHSVAAYGVGTYGVDYYADSLFNLTIESSARFKVMSRSVNFNDETITFGLREI